MVNDPVLTELLAAREAVNLTLERNLAKVAGPDSVENITIWRLFQCCICIAAGL